jgi:predicted DNA-binding protein
MNAKPTIVRLSEETKQRIKALVGTYGMAIFIREAIEAKLIEEEARPPSTELKRRERKPKPGPGE